jgi:hypothetical protein
LPENNLKNFFQTNLSQRFYNFPVENFMGTPKEGNPMIQDTFRRNEKKYLLTPAQHEFLRARAAAGLPRDPYGAYTLASLYFDTEDDAIARALGEGRLFKEKLRLRRYGDGPVAAEAPVFLELKRKYLGVAYKRRALLTYGEALGFLARQRGPDTQILREIDYLLNLRPLAPKMLLCYDRVAHAGPEGLRVTFDTHLRFRQGRLGLEEGLWGRELLPGQALMEIKTPGPMPLWLCRALSEARAFPCSFSKYGACYAHARQNPAASGEEGQPWTLLPRP